MGIASQNAALKQFLATFKKSLLAKLNEKYGALYPSASALPDGAEPLVAQKQAIETAIEQLMMFPDCGLVTELIDALEGPAKSDDGLRSFEYVLRQKLLRVRMALANADLADDFAWRRAEDALLSTDDDMPNVLRPAGSRDQRPN
jgi:hypothetical protein